jgi:Septum formation
MASVFLLIDGGWRRRRVVAKSDDPWSIASLDEDFIRGARVQELSAAERAKEAKALKKADRKGRRRRSGRRALGLLLPLAVVGGIVALSTRQRPTDGLSFKTSPTTVVSTSSTTGLPVATTTVDGATTVAFNGRTFVMGECVTWDQTIRTGRRDVQTVSCETAHLYEMVGMTEAPQQWTDGPNPTGPESHRMIVAACRRLAERYFGGPIDPSGFVELAGIHPSEQGWREGDRQIACALRRGVIDRSDATAVNKDLEIETVGSMRTSDQRFPWKIGDCLTKETWTLRVPCDEPHMYEFVGWGEPPSQAAPPDAHDPVYNERCAALAHTYQPETPPSIIVWNMTIEPESWVAGARSYACYLGSATKDLDGLPTKRVGSVRVVTV